jgi:magnesium-transporting ATPase (P-type)
VVLRTPDKEILIITKGADSVIFALAAKGQEELKERLNIDLEFYSEDGLRTLCYAMSKMTEDEYQSWSAAYEKASVCLADRDEQIAKVALLIEKGTV